MPIDSSHAHKEDIFIVGEVGRLTVAFSRDDVPESPEQVKLFVKPPDEAAYEIESSEIIEGSVEGEFYCDVLFDTPGKWKWRFEGLGGLIAVSEGFQWVNASSVV